MGYKIHECKNLPEGTMVVYSYSECKEDKNCWSLVIQKEATEDDLVENSYFENIGDTVWETVVEILHCPYCGKQLSEKFKNGGKFRCIDHSGWLGKEL